MSTRKEHDVIYDPKWINQANNKVVDDLEKFFDRAECYSHVPHSWAPEVKDLLEILDYQFGIARNTSTIDGYKLRAPVYKELVIKPITEAFKALMSVTSDQRDAYNDGVQNSNTAFLKLSYCFYKFTNQLRYGLKLAKTTYINPMLNRLFKPKINLMQVKIKFYSLRVYYSAPEDISVHVDRLIKKTEERLVRKGVYFIDKNEKV